MEVKVANHKQQITEYCRVGTDTGCQNSNRKMEKGMLGVMNSLVYDWLVSAGDEKLAKKFKEEVKPDPLPPNSLRIADIVKLYKKETPPNTLGKRKAEPLTFKDAKMAKKVSMKCFSSFCLVSSKRGVFSNLLNQVGGF